MRFRRFREKLCPFWVAAVSTVALPGRALPASYYPAGRYAYQVVTGDFNGDGKADLAVANQVVPGYVSVLLGNGDGTFQPAAYYAVNVGPNATSIAVGDFNGDGKPDLAVTDTVYSGRVVILLGNGDGTFRAPTEYAAGRYPTSIAAGDLNGDGKPDLAVGDIGTTGHSYVSILLGNGDGTFQDAMYYAAGPNAVSAMVGDLNGDGKPDLAVGASKDNNGYVSILLGNGDGTFQDAMYYAAGQGGASVALGDLNGDGKADLAVANSIFGNVSVLLGNGDGTFQAATQYAAGGDASSVAAGDFNGDGKPDLAVAIFGNNSYVSILLGNGDGTFQGAAQYAAGGNANSVAVGDFNGDGKPDLALANDEKNGYVTILLGKGDGTF